MASSLQNNILELLESNRHRDGLFRTVWVVLLVGSHYDSTLFSVCFVWYNFVWCVSRTFITFFSFRNCALIYEALSRAFLSARLWPSREYETRTRKGHEFRSFLQISVSFCRCRKSNLANWGTFWLDFFYPIWTYACLMSQQTAGNHEMSSYSEAHKKVSSFFINVLQVLSMIKTIYQWDYWRIFHFLQFGSNLRFLAFSV